MSPKLLREFYNQQTAPNIFPPVREYAKWMRDVRLKGNASDRQHSMAMFKIAAGGAKETVDYLISAGLLAEDAVDVSPAGFKDFWKAVVSNAAKRAKDSAKQSKDTESDEG